MSVDHWLRDKPDVQDPLEHGSDLRADLIVILRAAHNYGAFLAEPSKNTADTDQKFDVTARDTATDEVVHVEVTRMPKTDFIEAGYRFVTPFGTLRVTGQYSPEADITMQTAKLLLAGDGVRSSYGWTGQMGETVPEVGEGKAALDAGLWVAGLLPLSAQRIIDTPVSTGRGNGSGRR